MLNPVARQVLVNEILPKRVEFFFICCLFCFFACLAHISFKLIYAYNRYVNLYLLWYAYAKGNRTNELILVNMFK